METAVASGKKTSVPVSFNSNPAESDRQERPIGRDPWFNSSAVQ